MAEETLTRSKIAEAIYREIGISLAESNAIVDQIIDSILESAKRGEEIKISGFATFAIRKKNQRIGRNPKTKKEVIITPRKVISFRPALGLKKKMNAAIQKTEKKAEE